MTKTPETPSSSSNQSVDDPKPVLRYPLWSAVGPIPDDHFENEPLPPNGKRGRAGLSDEDRKKFDAETERLKQFQKR